MATGDKVRLGHSFRAEGSETLAQLLERILSILLGTTKLEPRTPVDPDAVDGAEGVLAYTPGTRPIYAYLGDVHPQLGVVGVVIERGNWTLEGASRCDTGGLFAGRGGFFTIPDPDRAQSVKKLSTPLSFDIANLDQTFNEELDQLYEGDAKRYVTGEQPSADKLHPDDPRRTLLSAPSKTTLDRRLWTWELRALVAPPSNAYVAIVFSRTAADAYVKNVSLGKARLPKNVTVVRSEPDFNPPSPQHGRSVELHDMLLGI